jgi:Protein of unknown function (DUF2630)
MDDATILDRISALVAREHALRIQREDGTLEVEAELQELSATEVQLDQCWDLLRQRRAKRDFGRDADEARARPATVVEHYWQ